MLIASAYSLRYKRLKKLEFSKIILSPGWGNPENSGVTMDVIDYYQNKLPILGVCLGMQCIAKYFGANIIKAPEPYHGKNSKIYFDENFELFKGMKQGFSATRYHSLVVDYSPCSLNRHLTPTLSSKEREFSDLANPNSTPMTFQETMSKLPKPSFMDKSDIGIKSSMLNSKNAGGKSVLRNLAERMR